MCFESFEQFKLWKDAARMAPPGNSGYCTDCTPDYQNRMIKDGRCEFPDTRFHTDKHGWVEGVRNFSKKAGRPRKN